MRARSASVWLTVLALVTACGEEIDVAPATTEPGSPVLVAYRRPCVTTGAETCESEAAEFAGTVEVVENCVLILGFAGGSNPRVRAAVLFPYGVRWSVVDGGIVTSDGQIARVGDWIYGGGGGSPVADLPRLDLTDEQRTDLHRCTEVAEPDVRGGSSFFEMGANDRISRLDGPPDF